MKKYRIKELTVKFYESMTQNLKTIFTWVFLLFFGIILFNTIFYNSNTFIHYDMKISTFIGIAILAILIGLYFIICKYKENLFNMRWKRWLSITVLIIMSVLIVICQVFLSRATYFEPGWDCRILIHSGMNLVINETAADSVYFRMFPNNICLVLIFKNIFQLSQVLKFINYQSLLVLINIIVIDLTVVFTLLLSKKILGKGLMSISYILAVIFLVFSPWINIPYSDSFSMIFPVLILYIYIWAKECENKIKKTVLLIAMGIFAAIGVQIKPTVIIIIVAIIISYALYNLKNKKDLIRYLATIILIFIGFAFITVLYNKKMQDITIAGVSVEDNDQYEIPFTHFLMMGMQLRYVEDVGTLYGAWSGEDYGITLAQPNKEQKISANLDEIERRLKEFGLKGYCTFLFNKANWILCDGNFYYGGEGSFMFSEPYLTDEISKTLQKYFISTGSEYSKLANFNEGAWITILILIVVPLFLRKKDAEEENIFTIRLAIVGITLFILFFEGRSRYLINHIPFFILLATYGVDILCNSVKLVLYKKVNNTRI